jgi:hypothetical protein
MRSKTRGTENMNDDETMVKTDESESATPTDAPVDEAQAQVQDVPVPDADDDEDDEDDDESDENGKSKKAPNGLYISTPEPLKSKIESEAAAAGKTPRAFVRDMLAQHWGLVLTPARTRTTYATPEEKKAAQKAKRTEKNALIKRLLEEHEKAQAAAAAEAAKLSTQPAA